MKFTILTIFPEVFDVLKSSILKRAEDAKRISIDIVNFRDYSTDKHKKVDDTLYGGGKGMLLMCQPIYDAINKIDPKRKALRIYTSPKGIQ
ncbi:MAG: tRNA (guanosine(37)-N1)-methyltransferase TrmD, partial [Firmicutes bacterium]|nr:tRNA (guanosine(37)-N1)-methyltransferase TrmD [Bacillota bacterium]